MKKISMLVGLLILLLVIVAGFFYFKNNKGKTDNLFLKDLKTPGVLVVGMDSSYGVMEFLDANNSPAGIDVDIINEVARRMNLKVIIKSYDWANIFPAIKDSKIDVAISSITITAERSKEMLFSAPYFNGGQVIIVKKDNKKINSLKDLVNKRVGVQTGTTSFDEAEKVTGGKTIIPYETWNDSELPGGIITDLKEDKSDAVIVDYIQAIDSVKKNPDLRIVGEPFTQEYYGIATNLGNTALIEEIDSILRDIKREGIVSSIEDKWINKK